MAARAPNPVVEKILRVVKERVKWEGFDKAALDSAVARLEAAIDVVKLHYLENCVGCAACAPACPYFYVDERFSPVNKAELTREIYRKKLTIAGRILGPLVGARLPKSEKDLDKIVEAVYRCTNCGHCYFVCPFGIDSGVLVQGLLKLIATGTGRAPTLIDFFAELERQEAYLEIQGFMDAWNVALQEAEKAVGKRLPYEKKGADVLLLPMLTDAMFYPGAIAGAVKTLEAAGIDYTLPEKPWAFRAAIGVVVGRREIAREVFARLVERIEALGVKRVVLLDGGFPYPWLRWEVTKLLGRRLGFKVLHFVELVDELIAGKKLPYEQGDDEVTWHDPCQLARRGGVTVEPYRVLKALSRRFRPLKHHGVESYCCAGGGGIGCMNMEMIKQMSMILGISPDDLLAGDKERRFIEETEKAWAIAVKRKIDEIRESGAKLVVTACPVCMHSIAGGAKIYGLSVDVKHIAEYVGERVKG
ncbi:protein of unknown function DUF224 cysteine-rich region domain protein [Pyrolobus fumarii 1A]|uniref:4Fe-4S ferredoxin-type domain-containing protein n=1 Tax=Pyrolobus fumarii (strain DSM 11204 / 1A) TaxID=694429 RepID=G0EE35_PYRF1|nr:(Fe-S)-binding protein [Pyrolobus fumarii]AEM37951.1 protein of unknown function DUF224 cysteine-rich region domain protein [Pyrolobus fumarii 1A]